MFPSISGDGLHVAFEGVDRSEHSDDRNGRSRVLVADLLAETTTLASDYVGADVMAEGGREPVISADGRTVAFRPGRDVAQLDDVYVRDLEEGTTRRVPGLPDSHASTGITLGGGALSGDGRHLIFIDVERLEDRLRSAVIVEDLVTGSSTRIIRDSPFFDIAISADSSTIAYTQTRFAGGTDLIVAPRP